MQPNSQNTASNTYEDADTLTEEISSTDTVIIEEENETSLDDGDESSVDQSEKENSRFKEGEIITMIRVRFPVTPAHFLF